MNQNIIEKFENYLKARTENKQAVIRELEKDLAVAHAELAAYKDALNTLLALIESDRQESVD